MQKIIMQICKDAKMQICKDAKMQRCKDAKMQRCKDAKMQRCKKVVYDGVMHTPVVCPLAVAQNCGDIQLCVGLQVVKGVHVGTPAEPVAG